jgi:hypothetical protein
VEKEEAIDGLTPLLLRVLGEDLEKKDEGPRVATA